MVPVRNDFIQKGTKRRSGIKMDKVLYIVAHDTGNSGSTAKNNVDYYKRTANEMSASAHVFIDDKEIVKCIPLSEKAWHVQYQKTIDNAMFGEDANDASIGVELCYDRANRKINKWVAYQNYVEYIALLCDEFKLDPKTKIVGHMTLDPQRKTDPLNAFKFIPKTWEQFINDVVEELKKYSKKNEKKD
jgi:N-acetylmuramoyl-L-alanine amidase